MRMPRSVRDADVVGKTVLVRADLNVPLADGRVADDTRIRASLPTLQYLLDSGAVDVRVCSHLGRPKTDEDRARYSMRAGRGAPEPSCCPTRGSGCSRTRASTRARRRTTTAFARELAEGCDVYVNDAFGSAHRAHASTEGVARLLPAYAGLLLEAELENLSKLLGEIEHPFVLISGGAKVEDKLGVLQHLGGRADAVLIGGKMAEEVRVENPLTFPVELPTDVVGAAEFAEDAETGEYPFDGLPDGWLGLDIGPETRRAFAARIAAARTIFWNGPMGVFEWAPFAEGTKAVAEAVAGERARVLGRRRRRLRARAERARPRRQDLVGLDRRRREPRVPRGQASFPAWPRFRRPWGRRHDRRRQLEDVHRPGAARARGAARRDRRRRRDRLPAVHRARANASPPG